MRPHPSTPATPASLISNPHAEHSHRGFAFVSYSSATAALDAIDNMHRNVLPGLSNAAKVLKVNMAKPPKGLTVGGSNRASKSRTSSGARLRKACLLAANGMQWVGVGGGGPGLGFRLGVCAGEQWVGATHRDHGLQVRSGSSEQIADAVYRSSLQSGQTSRGSRSTGPTPWARFRWGQRAVRVLTTTSNRGRGRL